MDAMATAVDLVTCFLLCMGATVCVVAVGSFVWFTLDQ